MLVSWRELANQVMRHDRLQQVARGAFSREEWGLLTNEGPILRRFGEINCVEDVERFIFEAHDRLRSLREQLVQEPREPACEPERLLCP